jgi:Zn-finger nucleic acid-binding protein
MKCPVDQNNLLMTERSGVELDYCPECRGVWLDRGELDKIVQRSGDGSPSDTGSVGRGSDRDSDYRSDRRDDHHDRDDRHDRDGRGYDSKKKGRGSFIGDIFGGLGGDD